MIVSSSLPLLSYLSLLFTVFLSLLSSVSVFTSFPRIFTSSHFLLSLFFFSFFALQSLLSFRSAPVMNTKRDSSFLCSHIFSLPFLLQVRRQKQREREREKSGTQVYYFSVPTPFGPNEKDGRGKKYCLMGAGVFEENERERERGGNRHVKKCLLMACYEEC